MDTLSIRDLDDVVREKLRIRAVRNGRSSEEEACMILTDGLAEEPRPDLFHTLMARFAELGGVELDIPRSSPVRIPELPA